MNSNDAREARDGPSRSDTGVEPKKNNFNRNTSSTVIKGQSKSSSTLSKGHRERSAGRSASSNYVRPRTQSSNRNLSRAASKSNERVVSRTSSKTREWDQRVSRKTPGGQESDRNLTWLSPKSQESDRNFSRTPRNKESGRNLGRPPPKSKDSDQNSSRTFRSKESDRNLSRPPPKSRESDRNPSRPPFISRESDRNLPRLLRSKASDYSVARSASKIRESDRNPPRLPKSKESDYSVARSSTRVRESDRSFPRPPLKNRDSDRNISRPVTRGKISDRNVSQPTIQCREVSRPASKHEKARDSGRPLPKSKDHDRSTFAPLSSTSVTGLARGQSSGTRTSKQKSSLATKLGGLNSHKIFSQLSLKKLRAFAFKKKKTANQKSEPVSILKGKERPRSADTAPSKTRLDEATQSSEPWTGSVGTSTKPSPDSPGTKQKSPSDRQSQMGQGTMSRPADRPDRGREALGSKPPKEPPSKQNVLHTPGRSAGRRLEPSYQEDDAFSVESFVDQPEKSVNREEYECYCQPVDSAAKLAWLKEESICSGESLTKPKADHVSLPESLVGEPTEPREDFVCSPEASVSGPTKLEEDYVSCPEDVLIGPPARDSVCSPEVSIVEVSQENQLNVCSPEISIGEPSSSSSQVKSLCVEESATSAKDLTQTPASLDCVNSSLKEDTAEKKIQSYRVRNSSEMDTPKINDSALMRSQSQLDVSHQPAVLKLPPKRDTSTFKLTTFECICIPSSSSERSKGSIENPCAQKETSTEALSERPKTPPKVCRDNTSSPMISECLNKTTLDNSRPFKHASEPSVKPRLERDERLLREIQSLPDLDTSEKKSEEVNICPPIPLSKHPRDEASASCLPQVDSNQQAPEDHLCGKQAISSENLARLKQVCSALRQNTLRTSDSSTRTAQYQLYAVHEGSESQPDATEAPSSACSSDMSRQSLPVVGHGRISKPPPADLTCHPEEPTRDAQSGSISDSSGSSFSISGDLKNQEKSSTDRRKDDSTPPKDGVWALREKTPLVQCKVGNESSDSTEPPPDESNLSSDVSHEKERSSDGEVSRSNPTASPRLSAEKETSLERLPSPSEKRMSLERPPPPSKDKSCERPPSPTTKPQDLPTEEGKLKSAKECPEGEGLTSKEKLSDANEQTKPRRLQSPKEATLLPKEHGAKKAACKPPPGENPPAGEKSTKKPRKSSPPKESSNARSKDVSKPHGPSPNGKLPESTGGDRPVCLPQTSSTADSNDSIIQKSAEQPEAAPAEEGTAARCEPITKLKLKKRYKEPTQSDLRDIQEDIRIWKDLYAGCLERLRSLQQMNQAPVQTTSSVRTTDHESANDKTPRRTSNNGHCSINEIQGGMDEAVRVLESEYGQVESALRKHSAVLAELVSVLQNRMTAQPEASTAGELDQDAVRDVKDSIHYLKALITENETLTMQLAAERAKQQVLRQVQVTNDVVDESISATEDKLHRTNSLLKMQMKRLQYEISRLTEAQNIEIKAGTILVEQAEADVVNDLETLEGLQESNERLHELLSSKRFVSGQRIFRSGSRGSFLSEEFISGTYCSLRRDQLECRLVISDRVQRNVELSNDEIQYLHALGRRMCNHISEMNEEIRKSEFAWLQLRKERDELTKDLYPDLERLQKMQDIAKEKLDLESKLRKENMLFRHQLEEFQKDLLEVETELMSGAITRRTEATKNKVVELETLYENAKLHNSKLREECDSKHLTISRHDSLASLSIDEEEFQRQISEKIQRMELRIQADMDRRLLRPKRYVLEAPGKAKVSFRGQRNVIRAPKNVAEWRRKREAPQGAAEPPKPQQPKDAQELRREILAKLAEEKERAKEQLLRYEAHQARHAADTTSEPNAQELNELLGRLGRFLNQTRAQEPSPARPATTEAAPSLHGGEFGETLMHLIVQLDQLQSALTGEDSRRRTVRPPTLASERHRELLETLPDASKRGSRTSNPTRQNNGNNNGNNNYS